MDNNITMSIQELRILHKLLNKFALQSEINVYRDNNATNLHDYNVILLQNEYYKAYSLMIDLICLSY